MVIHYGHLSYLGAIPIFLLLIAYLSVYTGLFPVCCTFLDSAGLRWIIAPSLWVVLEWIRGKLITGFPWNLLGYSQGDLNCILQTADLWGVYGVSWIVMLINTNLITTFSARGKKSWFGWIVLICLLTFCLFYGRSEISIYKRISEEDSKYQIAVSLVQGNIDQAQKWDKKFRRFTMNRYFKLTRQAVEQLPGVSLVIWPETAMPFFFGVERESTEKVINFAKNLGVSILFGSPGISVDERGKVNGFLNKAYLVGRDGKILGEYAKEHLVPFGEYVPLKKILFFVKRLVPAAGDFVPGKTPGIIKFGNAKIGLLICYEAIFPELARKRVHAGAEAIINISNDAWFGQTSAPFQHLEMAKWRAVEVRRPLIRCTNTGISAIINVTGTIKRSLSLFEDGFISGYIVPLNTITFYVRHGDVFVVFCALTVLFRLVYVLREFKKAREGFVI